MGPSANAECSNATWPRSSRVNIALPASGTVPRSDRIAKELEDHLVELGWTREDLETRPSSSSPGVPFTPEDLFKQEGASAVFIFGDGVVIKKGVNAPSSGTGDAFAIQAFDGVPGHAMRGMSRPSAGSVTSSGKRRANSSTGRHGRSPLRTWWTRSYEGGPAGGGDRVG